MKRITSLLLVILIIFATVSFTTSANGYDYLVYEKEIKLLADLGIIENSEADSSLTRAELAALAVKAIGHDNIAANFYDSVFTDVPPSHWAYKYIMFAHSIGLFNGTSTSTFEPDSPITPSQAIATMVKMLGFTEHANIKGGYPAGYWTVAASCGILDNTDINISGNIAREQLYALLYNTLHAQMLVSSGLVGDNANYVQDGSSILSYYLHIQYVEGVVTADGEGSILESIAPAKNRFNIGKIEFMTKDESITGKLGRRVRVYYKDKHDGVYEALHVWESENNELNLSSDSIVDFNYSGGSYKVIDNNVEKNYKIGNDYYLSYNGEAVFGSDPSLMLPSGGHITLIDNNMDGIYDVVLVKEYYNLVFGSYDEYTNTIKDIKDTTKNISLDDYDSIISEVDDYSSIPPKSILTVYKSKTKATLRIEVSQNILSGKITQIDSEYGYMIKDNYYKISLAPRFDANILKVGESYNIYLDSYNGITYCEVIPNNQSGYLLNFQSSSGLGKTKVQLLTLDGSLKAFDLAEKVSIETSTGISSFNENAVVTYFNNLTGSKRLYVLFNQNTKKEINRITLPKIIKTQDEYDNMGGYPLYKLDYYIYNWPSPSTSGHVQYKSKNMGYGNWLILDESTIVLNVINETQSQYSEDDFLCGSVKSNLRPDETIVVKKDNEGQKGSKEIDVYKIGDSGYAPDILIKYGIQPSRNVSDDNDFIVIKNLTQAINPQTEEAGWKLTYMQGTSEMSGFLSDDFANNRSNILSSPYTSSITTPILSDNKLKYEIGDIAKISKDLSGSIINLCLIYDSKNKVLSFPSLSAFNRIFRIIDGNVKYIDNGYLEIESSSGNTIERSRIDGCTVTVADNFNEEIRTGSFDDISIGDQIVIYSRYGDNKTVVVYKNRR